MKKNILNFPSLTNEMKIRNYYGYSKEKIPCALDFEVSDFLRALNKNALNDGFLITQDDSFLFYVFIERMAIMAVRNKNEECIFLGILAIIVEGLTNDYRESLMLLSLLNHSSIKIMKNLEDIVSQLKLFMNQELNEFLNNFISRKPEDKSIGVMGYEEMITDDGFSYKRTW